MHAQENQQLQVIRTSTDRVHRNGEAYYDVHASAFVRASQQQAWALLTDYDRLADFVPDLQASTVLARSADTAVVEQRSKTGFLFISHDIHLVLQVDEHPYSHIDVSLISGDMKHYAVRWELTPLVREGLNGTRIDFSASVEPEFFVPPLFGSPIVEVNVRQMLRAVVQEIEQRSAH